MHHNNQHGFAHLIFIIIFVAIIAAVGFAGWQVYLTNQSRHGQHYQSNYSSYSSGPTGNGGPAWNAPQNNEILEAANMPSCHGTNLFSAPVADLATINYIDPLGNTSSYNGNAQHVIPVDHMYFNFNHTQPSKPLSPTLTATLLSPGNVEIYQVKDVTYIRNNVVTGHDYTIFMAPCKEVTVYLGHIDTINQAVQGAVAQATGSDKYCQPDFIQDGTTFRPCNYAVTLNLQAGEQLGTAGGPGVATQAFDFGVYDSRISPLPFIDPKYWTPDNLHAVCGLSYYADGAVKTAQFQKVMNTKLTNGLPDCGTNMWDKAGTIQGNWVLPGTPTGPVPDQQGLAIVPYNKDPSQGDIDWGGTIAPADRITFKMAASGLVNRTLTDVTADGKVYCFSDTYKAISLQLIDSNTLKVQERSGSCPASPALTSPTTYVR